MEPLRAPFFQVHLGAPLVSKLISQCRAIGEAAEVAEAIVVDAGVGGGIVW